MQSRLEEARRTEGMLQKGPNRKKRDKKSKSKTDRWPKKKVIITYKNQVKKEE
jgi:hypothetical protein